MFLTILSSLFHLGAEVHAALFTELIGNISLNTHRFGSIQNIIPMDCKYS